MTVLLRLTLGCLGLLVWSCEATPSADTLLGTTWESSETVNWEEPAEDGLNTTLVFSSLNLLEVYTTEDENLQLLDRATYHIANGQLILQYQKSAIIDTTLISRRGDKLELLDPETKRGKRFRLLDQSASPQ